MSLDIWICEGGVRAESLNITHNLGEMAEAAGIYMAIWRPEQINIKTASELQPILRKGLSTLLANPQKFKHYEPENGWGTYENFVSWLESYDILLSSHPNATIIAHR